MDWYVIGIGFVVFVLPALVFAVGVACLEDMDTTGERGWKGGEGDPFKYVIYDRDHRMRRGFRPLAYALVGLYLIVVIRVSLSRMH